MKWLIIGVLSGLAIGIGAGVGIGFGIWGSTSTVTNSTVPVTTSVPVTTTTIVTTVPITTSVTSTSVTEQTVEPFPIVDTSGISKLACPYDVTRRVYMNFTWTPSSADEIDALQRIGLIMEGALLYYRCFTNITIPKLTIVYDRNVTTATGSMALRTITFGANRQYMTLRVAMHELSHVLGMGTLSAWYAQPLNNATFVTNYLGVWSGREVLSELENIRIKLGDLETGYIRDYLNWSGVGTNMIYVPGVVYMFDSHFAPYGLMFEDEITGASNPVDVYIAHCRMMMAFRRDMLLG